MVKTSAAAGAGLWVAPSVFTFDRAAAAIGSCGAKPLQVDMSTWAGNLMPTSPSSFFANDGTEIWMSIDDSDGVQDSYWQARAHSGTLNGRDHPVITGMSGATGGDAVAITFTFDTPVRLSFFLVDVDSHDTGWEDKVSVIGRLSPSTTNIDPDSMTTGSANTQISSNTVRGDFSSNTSNSNVEVDFQTPIDTLVVTHFDDTSRTAFQWIGIHDFHWC